MKPTLYIIRGLPGSGKTTLANKIAAPLVNPPVDAPTVFSIEADQFFVSSNGHQEVYEFDRRFLGAAHDECYGRVMRYLRKGYSVAVSNPFTTNREVSRYLDGLKRTGLHTKVDVKIIKCVGKFKSIHNIPSRAIDKMRDRWEDVEGEITFNGNLT